MKLTGEKIDKQYTVIKEVLPLLSNIIEGAAEKYFSEKEDRRNFVLSCCVNLLGNLTIDWTEDTLEAKLLTTCSSVQNLLEWYQSAVRNSKNPQDIH